MARITISAHSGQAVTLEVQETVDMVWSWLGAPGFFLKVTEEPDGSDYPRPVIINKKFILTVSRGVNEK